MRRHAGQHSTHNTQTFRQILFIQCREDWPLLWSTCRPFDDLFNSAFLEIRVWVFPRSRVPFQGDDTDYRARRHIPTGGFPNPIMFAPQLGAEIQPVHLVFHCENFELRGVGSSKTTKVFHLHQPCL